MSWFRTRSHKKSTKTNGNDGFESPSPSSASSRSSSPIPSGHDDQNGLAEYARKRRELLRLARALANLGATDLIEVPRIVVIGAQSTGKSSLVEAVTGINVPRDSGTCTRCPMECTITASGPTWSCTIFLRIVDGTNSGAPSVVPFSPVIKKREQVEVWIRAAQAAVLCPHLPQDSFKGRSREELKVLANPDVDPQVLAFTKNVVIIDICDPRGADLSFVDLPGLIQNPNDVSLVPLVEDMAKTYIEPKSTIILVTVMAADDLENAKALTLAKHADSEKNRTIGVVTKPDGITSGDTGKRETWKELFDGKGSKHKLAKGYYCVRLPTDQERRSRGSSDKAQRIEEDFFRQTAPWKDLTNVGRQRLGVPNLVRDISNLLMGVIQEALPGMRTAAAQQLAACRTELDALPQMLTSDATAEVIRCVVEFCETMRGAIHGESADKAFVHECRRRFRMFERTLRSTAPDFRPGRNEDPVPDPAELAEYRPVVDRDQFGEPPIDFTPYPTGPITLADVTQVIRDSTGWELPHNIPYEAKKRLIERFLENWPHAETECFDSVAAALRTEVQTDAEEHFGRFPALKKFMRSKLDKQLDAYVSSASPIVRNTLKSESDPYGTQNLRDFNLMRDLWRVQYKRAGTHIEYPKIYLPPPRTSRTSTGYESDALTALSKLGITNVIAGDLYRLQPLEDISDEVSVMADVRSYFQVTYKRVADVIPEAIKLNLLFRFVDSLQAHLIGSLGLGSADAGERMEALLDEDPLIARERKRLQDRLAQLSEINRHLANFTF